MFLICIMEILFLVIKVILILSPSETLKTFSSSIWEQYGHCCFVQNLRLKKVELFIFKYSKITSDSVSLKKERGQILFPLYQHIINICCFHEYCILRFSLEVTMSYLSLCSKKLTYFLGHSGCSINVVLEVITPKHKISCSYLAKL